MVIRGRGADRGACAVVYRALLSWWRVNHGQHNEFGIDAARGRRRRPYCKGLATTNRGTGSRVINDRTRPRNRMIAAAQVIEDRTVRRAGIVLRIDEWIRV